jgi:hypothetical protein
VITTENNTREYIGKHSAYSYLNEESKVLKKESISNATVHKYIEESRKSHADNRGNSINNHGTIKQTLKIIQNAGKSSIKHR